MRHHFAEAHHTRMARTATVSPNKHARKGYGGGNASLHVAGSCTRECTACHPHIIIVFYTVDCSSFRVRMKQHAMGRPWKCPTGALCTIGYVRNELSAVLCHLQGSLVDEQRPPRMHVGHRTVASKWEYGFNPCILLLRQITWRWKCKFSEIRRMPPVTCWYRAAVKPEAIFVWSRWADDL